MSKSEIDQTKDGIIAITVCIAQILTESDPTFAARLEARLAEWSGALTNLERATAQLLSEMSVSSPS
jgi:hypothetical protein